VEDIGERQLLVESHGKHNPLMVFAEGMTTNGTSLLKFKKGALYACKRVKPIVIQVDRNATVSPAFDVMEMLPLLIM